MSQRITGYGKNRTNFYALAELLEGHAEFYMGHMRATANPSLTMLGQLPPEYLRQILRADYVVYSYQTPIAWHNRDGQWVQPDVKYSPTTTKHQGKIAVALSVLKDG